MVEWILGSILIASSFGILIVRKPVYACLCFLVTLLALAGLFLELDAQFIAVMQVLVYAGAILVLFMFVIILFQDAYLQIERYKPRSKTLLISIALTALAATLLFIGKKVAPIPAINNPVPEGFGTVQALGKALYIDFFLPFEAVTLLLIVALVGALHMGKKEI